MSCTTIITSGIERDCSSQNAAIGMDKDLILVNYDDFDKVKTFDATNRETVGINTKGLKNIFLKLGTIQHIFEGTDYSVVPTITPEVREDGGIWYTHSILFTVYSKKAKDRKTLESLGKSRVIAIAKDRSTGLFELFGAEKGLRASNMERPYTGAQNSNFYQVTIATPEIDVVKETNLGELANLITTNLT